MKNKLTELNELLFNTLANITKPNITDEQLKQEMSKGNAISRIAKVIVDNTALQLDAFKTACDNGYRPNIPDVLSLDNKGDKDE